MKLINFKCSGIKLIVLLIFSVTLIYFTGSLNTNTIVFIEDYLVRRNQQVVAEDRHNLRNTCLLYTSDAADE